ncbi:hypothetical protein SuNHUV7_02340 (plasmid) [Pseudoseohaeicola sp. NH-UV-7]|jgi:hypothetical protein|uniref:hypothetical protein n=1 Tax=unclassified Sulfitobacter TaxID=196795 RepID=UPI0013B36A55|nr:hypothetical protein [Sulfitobacter sp. JL08]
MNELHRDGEYDPFAIRKKHTMTTRERFGEIAEATVIALVVCALVYHLFLG